MKIRLVKSWNRWPPGHVLEPGDGVGNVLIARGLAVAIEAEPTPQGGKSEDRSGGRRASRR